MSVYERAQATGMAAPGPNHRGAASMLLNPTNANAEGALPPDDIASPAPNYRPADANSLAACENCLNFDVDSRHCKKYDFEANPTKVCDGWESVGGDGNVPPPMAPTNMPPPPL